MSGISNTRAIEKTQSKLKSPTFFSSNKLRLAGQLSHISQKHAKTDSILCWVQWLQQLSVMRAVLTPLFIPGALIR
jgi:hypothetical protein